jgi:hypothetical protein
MMLRLACWAIGAVVAACVWLIAASYLFVFMGGLQGRLERPSTAWLLYAASSPTPGVWTLLGLSAAVPLVLAALLVTIIIRHRFKPTRQREVAAKPLYGDSHWAKASDMQAGGIKRSKSAF